MYSGILIFIVAQILTFCVVSRENMFLDAHQIYVPSQPSQAVSLWPGPVTSPSGVVTETPAYSSLGPILIYFFAVVIALGIVLFLIPVSALRPVLRFMFAFLFCWGVFIALVFWLPLAATIIIAAIVAFSWFLAPRVWLHDLVMIVAMVSFAAVFGHMISPWTSMVILLILAVYDLLAVRFGLMLWIAGKLSQSNALPAFIIPRHAFEWTSGLEQSAFTELVEENPSGRKYSVLGGGDVGFPLLLTSSVYFAHGFAPAALVAVSALIGLAGAYWMQATFLKGKPMPALPPIATLYLVGLLVVR